MKASSRGWVRAEAVMAEAQVKVTVTAAERMLRRCIVLSGHPDREGISPMVGFPLLLIPLAVYNIIA